MQITGRYISEAMFAYLNAMPPIKGDIVDVISLNLSGALGDYRPSDSKYYVDLGEAATLGDWHFPISDLRLTDCEFNKRAEIRVETRRAEYLRRLEEYKLKGLTIEQEPDGSYDPELQQSIADGTF